MYDSINMNHLEKKQVYRDSWFPGAGDVSWDWLQMDLVEFYGINILKLFHGNDCPILQIYLKILNYTLPVIFWYIPIKLLKLI